MSVVNQNRQGVTSKLTILVVVGSRPEVIKMAPVVFALQERPRFRTLICHTAQHRDLADDLFALFGIERDFDLDVMTEQQSPNQVAAKVLTRLERVLRSVKPAVVLVHGDTTTTLAATLAAFHMRTPVGHVEAGLRTHNLSFPFPEEANRLLADHICTFHFAPTKQAAENLAREGITGPDVVVTGNTAIDALLWMKSRVCSDPLPWPTGGRKLVLMTAHRRESFGEALLRVFAAVTTLCEAHDDIEVVYPVHPNPNVRVPAEKHLKHPRVHLVPPMDYRTFVSAMCRSVFILTDSGGIQEEAPSLNVPVLVLRSETERPECVEVGAAKLVGTDPERIVAEALLLLSDPEVYHRMASVANPFGDGMAGERIALHLADCFS